MPMILHLCVSHSDHRGSVHPLGHTTTWIHPGHTPEHNPLVTLPEHPALDIPRTPPFPGYPHGQQTAVRILLECFLVPRVFFVAEV